MKKKILFIFMQMILEEVCCPAMDRRLLKLQI